MRSTSSGAQPVVQHLGGGPGRLPLMQRRLVRGRRHSTGRGGAQVGAVYQGSGADVGSVI
jgi:hypothetical protein